MFFHKANYFWPFLWIIDRINSFSSFLLNSLIDCSRCDLFLINWFLSPKYSSNMFQCFSFWINLVKLLSVLFLAWFQILWLKRQQVQKSLSIVLSNHFSNDLLMCCSLWFRNSLSVHLGLDGFRAQAAFGILGLVELFLGFNGKFAELKVVASRVRSFLCFWHY